MNKIKKAWDWYWNYTEGVLVWGGKIIVVALALPVLLVILPPVIIYGALFGKKDNSSQKTTG